MFMLMYHPDSQASLPALPLPLLGSSPVASPPAAKCWREYSAQGDPTGAYGEVNLKSQELQQRDRVMELKFRDS